MKNFTRLFLGFGVLILGLNTFDAGIASVKHYYMDMTIDLVVAAFWVGIMVLMHRNAIVDAETDVELENLKRMEKVLKELADAEEKRNNLRHERKLAELLIACTEEVTGGGKAPKPKQIPLIETMFAERSDGHFVRLSVDGNKDMEAHIQDHPFNRPPRTVPVKKTVTRARKINVKTPAKLRVRKSTK